LQQLCRQPKARHWDATWSVGMSFCGKSRPKNWQLWCEMCVFFNDFHVYMGCLSKLTFNYWDGLNQQQGLSKAPNPCWLMMIHGLTPTCFMGISWWFLCKHFWPWVNGFVHLQLCGLKENNAYPASDVGTHVTSGWWFGSVTCQIEHAMGSHIRVNKDTGE
jgi:hypothetical protein